MPHSDPVPEPFVLTLGSVLDAAGLDPHEVLAIRHTYKESGLPSRWQPRLLVGVADGKNLVRVQASGVKHRPKSQDERLGNRIRVRHRTSFCSWDGSTSTD